MYDDSPEKELKLSANKPMSTQHHDASGRHSMSFSVHSSPDKCDYLSAPRIFPHRCCR
jgi:hypothetical protein